MYIKPSLVRENSARAHSIFWRRFSASRTRRTSSLSSSASQAPLRAPLLQARLYYFRLSTKRRALHRGRERESMCVVGP